MTRYIDADALVKSYEYVYCRNCTRSPQPAICKSCWVDDAVDVVLDSPDEDVAPVVHAHWERIWIKYSQGYYCTNCNAQVAPSFHEYAYCPNCGAKMDEEVG